MRHQRPEPETRRRETTQRPHRETTQTDHTPNKYFLLEVYALKNHLFGGPCAQQSHFVGSKSTLLEVRALKNQMFGGPHAQQPLFVGRPHAQKITVLEKNYFAKCTVCGIMLKTNVQKC